MPFRYFYKIRNSGSDRNSNSEIQGLTPISFRFYKRYCLNQGAKMVLECTFGGQKGAFKQYQENLSV